MARFISSSMEDPADTVSFEAGGVGFGRPSRQYQAPAAIRPAIRARLRAIQILALVLELVIAACFDACARDQRSCLPAGHADGESTGTIIERKRAHLIAGRHVDAEALPAAPAIDLETYGAPMAVLSRHRHRTIRRSSRLDIAGRGDDRSSAK